MASAAPSTIFSSLEVLLAAIEESGDNEPSAGVIDTKKRPYNKRPLQMPDTPNHEYGADGAAVRPATKKSKTSPTIPSPGVNMNCFESSGMRAITPTGPMPAQAFTYQTQEALRHHLIDQELEVQRRLALLMVQREHGNLMMARTTMGRRRRVSFDADVPFQSPPIYQRLQRVPSDAEIKIATEEAVSAAIEVLAKNDEIIEAQEQQCFEPRRCSMVHPPALMPSTELMVHQFLRSNMKRLEVRRILWGRTQR